MKKVISMIVAIAMLVAMFSTVINLGTAFAAQDYTASGQNVPAGMLGWTQNVTSFTTLASTGFTAQIDSVSGKSGETITVPMKFVNVPSKGIMTFDLTLLYDSTKLEYVSGEAGSIVKNASSNFEINKEEDGKLRLLYLDMTVGDEYINTDGTVVNIKFNVKTSASTTTTISVSKGTFGDIDLNPVTTTIIDGVVSLNGSVATSTPVTNVTPTPVSTFVATGFTAQIASVSGESGQTITVPLNIYNVPSSGVMTFDLTITYDASKLEYVSGEAGSIVTKPSENFEINKEEDGKLRVLFLDMSVGDACITSDGTIVNMKFNVKTSAKTSTTISVVKGTFGDVDLNGITTKYVDGVIALNAGVIAPPTDPVTSTPVPVTPTPTTPKTATPVPGTPTPVKTYTATEFTALIDSVSGKAGETIDVPLYILKVPSKGVMTCDLTITYDASKLEYVGYEAGSIVKNASENFEINKEEDGKLRLLYLDMTVGDQYITSDGILVNMKFNVKTSQAVSTIVSITKGTFGDVDLNGITTKFVDGVIALNGGGTIVTPTPTKTEATRTPTPTPTPTPTSTVVSNLKVEFYNTNTQADSNSIYPKFRLTNTGSSPINLADLKLRYYYTIDGEKSQTFWCDWSPVGSNNVTGKFEKLSPAVTGADYYLEISFSSGAGSLAPNTPIEVQGRFAKSDWTNYNQADDYSFNSSATNYTTWNKVTAYLNGKLVWGIEPNGSVSTPTPTATPTNIVTITPTPTKVVTNTPNPNAMTVTIGTVQGAPGQAVSVPVTIAKVPSSGVTTFDMTIVYDSSVLEYVSYEPGSIIKNPSENFEINKEEDGKLRALFLDMTVENESITADGLIANLNFKIKSNAKAGTSTSVETSGKSTFGDPDLSPIPAVVIGGKVEIIDASATKFTIGKVTGKAGSEVEVPLTLEGVPDVAITTCDMTIVYDTSILEYVGYEAGSIVKSANENLEINKEEDGKLRVLYLDMTVGDESIEQDGVFATLKFKIKSSAANGAVAEISRSGKATFGDKDINPISVTIINGSVTVGEASTTTPTPTSPVTVTPTPTSPVTTTPTPTAPIGTGSRLVIETVEGNPGASVAVPVKLYGVPSEGVMTADMAIIYDTSKLEYISYEAGSIVANPRVNLEVNKEEDGLLRVLFLDDTVGDQLIKEDGVFFTLNFNVKSSAAEGSTADITVRDNKAVFGDPDVNPIKFEIINGKVKVVKTVDPNGFKISIGKVDGVKGQEVIVPIILTNVPASGIMASDGVIEYDATKLEYVTYEPGSMIANPSTDFEINKEEDGKLKLLFLDYTVGDHLITEDGIFATVVFKVLGDEGLTEIKFNKITFGDENAEGVEVAYENGGVNIGSQPVGFKVSGYINPDFMTTSTTAPIVNAGFKVELVGTGKTAVTDSDGYFEIKDVPAGTYKVKITKDNYLTREIADVQVSGNKELSTSEEPILLWAGDMIIDGAQDGAINLEDIMEICKSFNTTSSDAKYKADSDLNKDGAINLEDVMIVAKHFNKVSSDYK